MADNLNTADLTFGGTVAMSENELRQAYGAAHVRRNLAEQELMNANRECDMWFAEMTRRGLVP